MVMKAGGAIWKVIKTGTDMDKLRTMYGSFSISKGKSGFTLAFVGSLNSDYTKVFSYCKTGFPRK